VLPPPLSLCSLASHLWWQLAGRLARTARSSFRGARVGSAQRIQVCDGARWPCAQASDGIPEQGLVSGRLPLCRPRSGTHDGMCALWASWGFPNRGADTIGRRILVDPRRRRPRPGARGPPRYPAIFTTHGRRLVHGHTVAGRFVDCGLILFQGRCPADGPGVKGGSTTCLSRSRVPGGSKRLAFGRGGPNSRRR